MTVMPITLSDEEEKKYRRLALRSQFVSLFCAKSRSLDISGRDDWTIEDIADIAHELGIRILIGGVVKKTGKTFTPHDTIVDD